MNEHQAVTRGIKHWGLDSYSNILPRIKFGVTGQRSSSQFPNDFIPPSVVCKAISFEERNNLKDFLFPPQKRKVKSQHTKHDFTSPSLQSSLSCQTHAFFANAHIF